MNWLLITVALTVGQVHPAPHRNIHEIRKSLNRFDPLDEAALDAKAKEEAAECQIVSNVTRRIRIRSVLADFAGTSLHVSNLMPAEKSLISNIADKAAGKYDKDESNPAPVPPVKGWYNIIVRGQIITVWGWPNPTGDGTILFQNAEQPQQVMDFINNAPNVRVTVSTYKSPT